MSQKKTAEKPNPYTQKIQITDISFRNSGFDSLRGIFAIMVFFSHVELMKYYNRMEHLFENDALFQLGRIGVTGFFALSGFLITAHLLKVRDEPTRTTSEKVKTFYIKRILRIWPLYYTIILLSLYVFPHIPALHFDIPPEAKDARMNIDKLQYYYLFLLPHVPLAQLTVLPFAEPSWSIGVEEIFYLLIPILIFSTKRLLPWLAGLFIAVVIGRYLAFFNSEPPHEDFLLCIFTLSRFDCILAGCIAGVLYYEKRPILQKVNTSVFGVTLAVLVISILAVSRFTYQYYHYAILFTIIIVYVALNSQNILNNKVLQFYGKISFSLYMTHEIVIVLLIKNYNFADEPPVLLHLCSFIAATGLGFISYKIIEEPFLKMKSKVDKQKTLN
ncbi:MAG: acyltransferase family protein [Flavipsychrobacter sp.]